MPTIKVESASPNEGVDLLGDGEGLACKTLLINFTLSTDHNAVNWDYFSSFDGNGGVDFDITDIHSQACLGQNSLLRSHAH